MSKENKNVEKYLGDGVYAEIDPTRGLILTTRDGYSTSNMIVLEPSVFINLIKMCEDKMEIEGLSR